VLHWVYIYIYIYSFIRCVYIYIYIHYYYACLSGFQTLSRARSLPYTEYLTFFSRIKSYGRDSDHSSQPSPEIAMGEYIILRPYKFTWPAQGLLSIYLLGRQLRNSKIHYTNWYEILIFTFVKKISRRALGPTHLPIQRGVISPRENRPGPESCQLPSSSSKRKNVWRFNSRSVLCLHNVHRDNLTLTSRVSFNYNRWP
jgi:hypothetical protein